MRHFHMNMGELPVFMPPGSVIPFEAVEALTLADAIERRARSCAAQQLRKARAKGRQVVADSRPEGIAQGLERFIEAEKRLNGERQRLAGQLKPLLEHCIRRVLGEVSEEVRLPVILRDILSDFDTAGDVRIMVHPQNRARFEAALAGFSGPFPAPRVAVDEGMSEEDCLVYAGPEVIDISIPAIAREMVEALSFDRNGDLVVSRDMGGGNA